MIQKEDRLVSPDHILILQLVIGVGYDGLRTPVQQLFNAGVVLLPSGGAEEVQTKAP